MGIEQGDNMDPQAEASNAVLASELKAIRDEQNSDTSEERTATEDESPKEYSREYLDTQAKRLREASIATEVYFDPTIMKDPVPLPEGMTTEELGAAMDVLDKLRRHYEGLASTAH